MSLRSKKVIVSHEADVLRKLRNKYGLSMREAGKRLGYSSSYISQIENGRADSPKGDRLKPYLDLYGKIGAKYFYELCRNWEKESTDEDFIKDGASPPVDGWFNDLRFGCS